MIKLKEILIETDISKYKKWYHVSSRFLGDDYTFEPEVPIDSRLKGEDKKTPRVSVAPDWRNAIYMLVVIRRSQNWYVYETTETPIDPVSTREELIAQKKLRKSSNDFRSPDAEQGAEAWFLEPIKMKYAGMVDIGRDAYVRLIMSMGMGDGGINYKNLKLQKNVKPEPTKLPTSLMHKGRKIEL